MADEQFFERLARAAGTPVIDEQEITDILDLAREVAHRHERRFAPVTAYVAGLALAGVPADQRRARLSALTQTLVDLDG